MKCKNKDCWWYDACNKTVKACEFFQIVDKHWKKSPNNEVNRRYNKYMSTADKK